MTQKQTALDFCQQELIKSQKIAFDHAEIIPRFTLFCQPENLVLFVQLAEQMSERLKALQMVNLLMIHKKASGFMLAGETIEPNSLTCTYIDRTQKFAAYQLIERNLFQQSPNHIKFGEVKTLEEVDPLLAELLPAPDERLTREQQKVAEQIMMDCVQT